MVYFWYVSCAEFLPPQHKLAMAMTSTASVNVFSIQCCCNDQLQSSNTMNSESTGARREARFWSSECGTITIKQLRFSIPMTIGFAVIVINNNNIRAAQTMGAVSSASSDNGR